MRFSKREFRRLNLAKSCASIKFPHFGVNKKQEITRLIYEISKREESSPGSIIKDVSCQSYAKLKKYLLQRRYPDTFFAGVNPRYYLPKIELKPSEQFKSERKNFSPKQIFIEKNLRGGFLINQFKKNFPQARFIEIDSLKSYLCRNRGFKIKDYNKRRNRVFITNERFDFFKRCPCTKNALPCGYHIFNLGFGCIYDCAYCYLQEYANTPGIILPANINKFFERFRAYKKPGMRIGTGEFSDSLALDRITEYSLPLIEFFRKQKGVTFEFKTKSIEVKNLLKTRPSSNIIVSWSLSPQSIIDENEYFCPGLEERLGAARECSKAGYRVGFHFDPVIHLDGWQREYKLLIENLFSKIEDKMIAWVSLGTFRLSRGLKQVMERRFPGNKILNAELLLGYDNKLRYSPKTRFEIYKQITGMLFKHSPDLKVYLCMEDASMWKDLGLHMPELR